MPQTHALLPLDYGATLKAIQDRVRQERTRVVRSATAAVILLYWDIGKMIVDRQRREGWGAKVVERLGRDLRRSFPAMQSFSTRNLRSMRVFAEEIPDAAIVKQLVSQLPWGHVVRVLQRIKEPAAREWYFAKAAREGWSRSVLEFQMLGNGHERRGRAITNFETTLAGAESRLAEQSFKDPYLFDFLGTADLNRERQVEQALVDHIQRFMLELGNGFAFVGRQVLVEVGDQEFHLDLLFFEDWTVERGSNGAELAQRRACRGFQLPIETICARASRRSAAAVPRDAGCGRN